MNVIAVTPLSQKIPHENLSYFSKHDVHIGDLVEMHIKKKITLGIVTAVSFVKEEKQELRHALYGLKKMGKIIQKEYIEEKVMHTLIYCASYHLVSIGTLLHDLIPEKIIMRGITLFQKDITLPISPHTSADIYALQHTFQERITRYKSIIRENFAQNMSVIIMAPTIRDVEHIEEALGKGISEYTVTIHSGLSEKTWKTHTDQIQTDTHPLLIISTVSLLPFIRCDIGTLILEREHSHYYHGHKEQIDFKHVMTLLAKTHAIQCILSSPLISLSTYQKVESKEIQELIPLQQRNDTGLSLVTLHKETKSPSFYFAHDVYTLLSRLKKEESGHYFIYAHRKGMYPSTICSDCGSLFTCRNCNKPYVLHKIGGVRTYVCHNCEDIQQVHEDISITCNYCDSWRLQTLGVATGGIEEALSLLSIPTFCIDGERTNTKTKVKKEYKAWKESKYGILIGTEMALHILDEADISIISSLDSLFSLPEYRTDEKIIHLITEIAEKTKEHTILQTRLPKMPIMKYIQHDSFVSFYKDTLEERKEAHLPPYYVIIKVTLYNMQEETKQYIESIVGDEEKTWFEAGGGKSLLFIHIQKEKWEENQSLRDMYKGIAFNHETTVNPLHFFL